MMETAQVSMLVSLENAAILVWKLTHVLRMLIVK